MDITKTIQELKKRPEFTDNVGMILIHNGVVRNWSRKDRNAVTALQVTPESGKNCKLCARNICSGQVFLR